MEQERNFPYSLSERFKKSLERLAFFFQQFLLVFGFQQFVTAENRRFGKLFATTQLSDQAYVSVFALIALQCAVDCLAIFNINNNHTVIFY